MALVKFHRSLLPNEKYHYMLRVGRYEFDFTFLSFTTWGHDGHANWGKTKFSFRCHCGQFSLGCKDHWLCGVCEPCRVALEDLKALPLDEEDPL